MKKTSKCFVYSALFLNLFVFTACTGPEDSDADSGSDLATFERSISPSDLSGVWLLEGTADTGGASLIFLNEAQRLAAVNVPTDQPPLIQSTDANTRISLVFQVLPTDDPNTMKWTLCSNEGGILQSASINRIFGVDNLDLLLGHSNYFSFRANVYLFYPIDQADALLELITRETFDLLKTGYMPVTVANNSLTLDLTALGQSEGIPLTIENDSELSFTGKLEIDSGILPVISNLNFNGTATVKKLASPIGSPIGLLNHEIENNVAASSHPMYCFIANDEQGMAYYRNEQVPFPYSYLALFASGANEGADSVFNTEKIVLDEVEMTSATLQVYFDDEEIVEEYFDDRNQEVNNTIFGVNFQGQFTGESVNPDTFLKGFSGEYATDFNF